jgi:hypothetical protein
MKGLVCPVSLYKINAYSSRLSVFFLVVLIGLYLWTGSIYFMMGVAFDYIFRIFEKVRFSPLSFVAHAPFKLFKLPVKHINKGPKVFASRMGLFFALFSVGFFYIDPIVSIVFASILLLCTFLDSVFNICFGCMIYHYLIYPFYYDESERQPE